MLLSIIVAMARNRCIGRDGRLPWHLPGDLQRFKQLTLGHGLLMGRKTYESIGKPLPGRTSYVLSRDAVSNTPGCEFFGDLETALGAAETAGETELFVCGGEEVYRQLLPRCGRIYLTELEREVAGDRFFPEFPRGEFQLVRQLNLAEEECYTYAIFDRIL